MIQKQALFYTNHMTVIMGHMMQAKDIVQSCDQSL